VKPVRSRLFLSQAADVDSTSPMKEINGYVARVAEHFRSELGPSLVEVYKLGSLAHGGFSGTYSDIDVGLLLNCKEPPSEFANLVTQAKSLHPELGKKLSVFWGNPEFSWGRLPVIDRLDLLDHGVPLLSDHKASFPRPTEIEIHQALRESIEKSWQPRIPELQRLTRLEAKDRKPYVRAILYAARLIFSWDKLAVDSNDCAVEYLHQVQAPDLDLEPIDRALACRRGQCTAEELFALRPDLNRQVQSALSYVSKRN
jgi:predicted nucleotidyltransferase